MYKQLLCIKCLYKHFFVNFFVIIIFKNQSKLSNIESVCTYFGPPHESMIDQTFLRGPKYDFILFWGVQSMISYFHGGSKVCTYFFGEFKVHTYFFGGFKVCTYFFGEFKVCKYFQNACTYFY